MAIHYKSISNLGPQYLLLQEMVILFSYQNYIGDSFDEGPQHPILYQMIKK